MNRHVLLLALLPVLSFLAPLTNAQESATVTEAAPAAPAPAPAPATAPAPAPAPAPAEAAPAPAAVTPVTQGTKLALFPFQTLPKIDTRAAAALVKGLTRALEDSGKFTLLERPVLANLSTELEFNRKNEIKTDSAAKWGLEHGADYVITGNVIAAGKGQGGMGIGGVRISAKSISLAVDLRLINCATAGAEVEDTFKEDKLGLGLAVGTVDFDPESNRGSEMVAIVLQQIVRAVLSTIHPPVVTQVDDGAQRVTLNYGSDIFAQDERWELFLQADGEKASKVGAIRITEVRDTDATGAIIDGTAVEGAVARFDKAGKKQE